METYDLESEQIEDKKRLALQEEEELRAIQKLLNEDVITFNQAQFPLLTQKLNYYFQKNHLLLKNTIIHNFLEIDEHLILFICSLYQLKPYQQLLDQKFREFYFEYRYVAYISKVLYYRSIHFDRQIRKNNQREAIVLDQPSDEETLAIRDLFGQYDEIEFEVTPVQLGQMFSNEKLARAFETITDKQKLVLYLAYLQELKDVEIAKRLNISQQSVSKTRNNALKKIRKLIGVN